MYHYSYDENTPWRLTVTAPRGETLELPLQPAPEKTPGAQNGGTIAKALLTSERWQPLIEQLCSEVFPVSWTGAHLPCLRSREARWRTVYLIARKLGLQDEAALEIQVGHALHFPSRDDGKRARELAHKRLNIAMFPGAPIGIGAGNLAELLAALGQAAAYSWNLPAREEDEAIRHTLRDVLDACLLRQLGRAHLAEIRTGHVEFHRSALTTLTEQTLRLTLEWRGEHFCYAPTEGLAWLLYQCGADIETISQLDQQRAEMEDSEHPIIQMIGRRPVLTDWASVPRLQTRNLPAFPHHTSRSPETEVLTELQSLLISIAAERDDDPRPWPESVSVFLAVTARMPAKQALQQRGEDVAAHALSMARFDLTVEVRRLDNDATLGRRVIIGNWGSAPMQMSAEAWDLAEALWRAPSPGTLPVPMASRQFWPHLTRLSEELVPITPICLEMPAAAFSVKGLRRCAQQRLAPELERRGMAASSRALLAQVHEADTPQALVRILGHYARLQLSPQESAQGG